MFIVRPDEIPLGVAKGWMYQQELNLKYIAITRAKKELIYDKDWREDDLKAVAESMGIQKPMPSVTMGV